MSKELLISWLGLSGKTSYPDIVKYTSDYRKFLAHMNFNNDRGRWSEKDLERHRHWRIKLDGIAEFIGLSGDEKKRLEREVSGTSK